MKIIETLARTKIWSTPWSASKRSKRLVCLRDLFGSHNAHRALTCRFSEDSHRSNTISRITRTESYLWICIRRTSYLVEIQQYRMAERVPVNYSRLLFRPRSLIEGVTDLARQVIIVIPLNRASHYPNALHYCNNYTMLALK